MDQHQLAFIRSTIAATLPVPATSTCHLCHGAHLSLSLTINVPEPILFPAARETPALNVAEPTVPPPLARCLTYPPSLKGAPQTTTDEHQLASVASNRSTSATAPPAPTPSMHLICRDFQGCLLDIFPAVSATPAINVAALPN